MNGGQQCFGRRQLELTLPLEELMNRRVREDRIMGPCHLPESVGGQIQAAHLPLHGLPDDAFSRRKAAARVALQSLKPPAFGDLAGIDRAAHVCTEAME